MQIVNCNKSIYKEQIINLYIEVFSTGLSEQHIDFDALELYISHLKENSFSYLAKKNRRLVGAILCSELRKDNLLPLSIQNQFNTDHCLYIAELMVSTEFQGQGIGSMLLDRVLDEIPKSVYSDVFIRVWKENAGAIKLYQKKGFKAVASIEQMKLKADGRESFVMEKIYLHKKLN